MAYSWCNKPLLDTLSAEGADNVLKFSAPEGEAQVFLDGDDIGRVIFSANGKKTAEIVRGDAHAIVVGEGNAQRDVYHYLVPGGPSPTMRLGITRHRGIGTWSSLPHHFELNTEPGFEEIFFYIASGATARGFQVGRGVWYNNRPVDAVWPIADRQFGTIPMGYHPVVGEPGVQISYVWTYLAKYPRWEKVN